MSPTEIFPFSARTAQNTTHAPERKVFRHHAHEPKRAYVLSIFNPASATPEMDLFTAAISVCSSPCAFVTVIISSMVVSLPLMLSVLRRNALFSERILFENRRDNITFSGTTHKKNNATIPFFESAIAAEISALITFGTVSCPFPCLSHM